MCTHTCTNKLLTQGFSYRSCSDPKVATISWVAHWSRPLTNLEDWASWYLMLGAYWLLHCCFQLNTYDSHFHSRVQWWPLILNGVCNWQQNITLSDLKRPEKLHQESNIPFPPELHCLWSRFFVFEGLYKYIKNIFFSPLVISKGNIKHSEWANNKWHFQWRLCRSIITNCALLTGKSFSITIPNSSTPLWTLTFRKSV